MRPTKLEQMSVDDLVDGFAAICIEQDRALLYSDIKKFNRIYDQMVAIREELKRRPGDQRKALVKLYDHPNAQVQLQAARASLAVEPAAARMLIEKIASSRKYPQAGDAGMTLVNLDRGVFKPA
jgi:ParB-like chromosome segregation protein Spo0J